MSILSSICEQASATIPFDKATAIKRFDRDYVAQQQIIAEQQLREELAREAEDVQIAGLKKNKKKIVVEEEIAKKKHKKSSFMEDEGPQVIVPQVKKINNLLSKICAGFDTKDGVDEEIVSKKHQGHEK